MTSKRFKKLLMARGVPRDTAEFIRKNVRMGIVNDDGTTSELSHEEFLLNADIATEYKK